MQNISITGRWTVIDIKIFLGEIKMDILFAVAFGVYFLGLTIVGWLFSSRQKNSETFSLGNRSINYWVTAVATHATDMSAWLFMAFPGVVYATGLFSAWSAIGLVIFMFLSWHFIAGKLRRDTEKYNVLTLPSYFEKRFKDDSGLIRIVSSLIAIFFFTLYISAGIVALGRALEATFGFSYFTSIILGASCVSIYTVLGGFIAVAWNDFLQGMFVFFVMLIFPAYALYHIGGFGPILAVAKAKKINLSLFPDFSLTTLRNILVPALGWGLGYFGQPHILVNFMGIDNPKDIKKSKILGLSWQIITLLAATLIGLIGIAFFKSPLANSELVFINMVKDLFTPLLAGFVLCAILAAAISTMDSQILVSASMFTEDFYKIGIDKTFWGDVYRPKGMNELFQKHLLLVSRISAIAIVLASVFLAINSEQTIFSMVRYAWCGLGSTFGPVLLLSLYWKKINRNGALAGILTGGLTSITWTYFNLPLADYSVIPGFVLSTVACVLISLIWRK